MRTALNSLKLQRPRSVNDALKMLRDDSELIPIAGCTDVYVGMNFGTLSGSRFIDLWPLDVLRKITMTNGTLSIGALASYTDVIKSRHVRRALPMLIESA